MMTGPRVLVLDIETSPALAWTFSLFKPVIGIGQVKDAPRILGVGYKWLGDRSVKWVGENTTSHQEMLETVWHKLDEATHVVGWNSKHFDIPWLNQQFLLAGLGPPSPFRHVDLLLQTRKNFRFLSNKLDWVAGELLQQHKLTHSGFALWRGCMEGDPKSWATMARYCKQDVALTERLYLELFPWLDGLSMNLYTGDVHGCPQCGSSENLQKRGTVRTAVSVYQRFFCTLCGKWSRATRREEGATVVEIK